MLGVCLGVINSVFGISRRICLVLFFVFEDFLGKFGAFRGSLCETAREYFINLGN